LQRVLAGLGTAEVKDAAKSGGTLAWYRMCLYAVGTVVKVKRGRKVGAVSDAAAEKVWREQGELGWAVAVRVRCVRLCV